MPVAANAPTRFDRVDALRGLAMVWMTAYHLCFDLNHFGLTRPQDFYVDPFWTWQRTGIVGLFLLCAGMGQALAARQGQAWPRFARRWAQVLGCAMLVTLASWFMFPFSWISFGVLHALAAMLLIARLGLVRGGLQGATPWLLGTALVLLAPLLNAALLQVPAAWPVFDSRGLNWLGVVSGKPATEDYVPLLPWLGVLLWGVGLAQWLARPGSWLAGPVGPLGRPLAVLGRWSLSYYMLHQPVLIGLLMVWRAVRPS